MLEVVPCLPLPGIQSHTYCVSGPGEEIGLRRWRMRLLFLFVSDWVTSEEHRSRSPSGNSRPKFREAPIVSSEDGARRASLDTDGADL